MKKPGEYANLLRSITKEWKWLLHYISHYRLHMVLYIVLGVVSIAMGLGSSVAAKHLIDAVVSHSSDTIFSAAAFAIAIALLQVVTSSVITRIASVVGTKVSNEIRESIYEHIVFSRWEDISKYHSGELLNRIEGDVTALAGSVVSFIPGVFTKLAQFAGCLIVVLYYDPVMAALAFLSSPFLLLTSKFSAKVMRKYNEQAREMNGKILSFYSESIQNIQTIKAFGMTRHYVEQLRSNLVLYRKLRLDHGKFSIVMTLCMSDIGLAVTYLCYGWGVWQLWQGAITYGTMTLFLQLSGQLSSSFTALVKLFPNAISIATAAGRIMDLDILPLEKDVDREKAEAMSKTANEDGLSLK